MGHISEFMDEHFLHFNSRETVQAARVFKEHVENGGKMFLSLGGAMSTARIGKMLSRMIRAGYIHGISCTGANLEEDIFNLLRRSEYESIPHYRHLSPQDEKALLDRGMNRVTDTAIPETVMRELEEIGLFFEWLKAAEKGYRRSPSEFMFDALSNRILPNCSTDVPLEESWVVSAMAENIPVWVPGWEDSTCGNVFAAYCLERRPELRKLPAKARNIVKTGTEQFESLIRWYLENCQEPGIGFFQIGGGIAGDFAICAVPCIVQDLFMHAPTWAYFCQISDAITSYGGYSGAPPNEKITWGKLDVDTPSFMIHSDATIVAPLIFAYVLND